MNSVNTKISDVINACDALLANDKLVVHGFGANDDLVLFIEKDVDFNPETEESNLVDIVTKQNGVVVDDAVGVYVTDGQLCRELERIYSYNNFRTL